MRLNWAEIWDDFDEWFDALQEDARKRKCKKCGRGAELEDADWEDQQGAIEVAVESEVKRYLKTYQAWEA
jgi:hypothetical protein